MSRERPRPTIEALKNAFRQRAPAAALILGVVLAVFGFKLNLIGAHGSDVPTVDQWYAEARALLIPLAEHSLKAKYFFVPHNEHRIVLTRLVNLGLTEANHQWDPVLEMTVNALVHAALAGILASLAWRQLKGAALAAATALLLALFAAPCAWENTLGGFQSQFYFMQLAAVGLLWLMVPARPLGGRWWAGFAVGVLALGTMASGFVAAVAALLILALRAWSERIPPRDWAAGGGLLGALCAGGALLVHTVPGSVQYHPSSIAEWLAAFIQSLSWPTYGLLGGFMVLQLPALLLLVRCLRRQLLAPEEWVLLGLCLWTWVQMALQAYGRAKLGILPKYSDLYTIGLFANGVVLARLAAARPRLFWPVSLAWAAAFAIGLTAEWTQTQGALASYDSQQLAQRQLLRDCNRTGDRSLLLSTPADQLPYPSAARLAEVMAHPGLHPLLPEGIRQPLPLRPSADSHGFTLYETPVPEGRGDVRDYAWMAHAGGARFVSDWLPASDLPWMRLRTQGQVRVYAQGRDGTRTVAATESSGLWSTRILERPPGTVRIVVETGQEGSAAFTNPVELGGGTRLSQELLGCAQTVTALGLALTVLALSLLMRERRARSDRPQG